MPSLKIVKGSGEVIFIKNNKKKGMLKLKAISILQSEKGIGCTYCKLLPECNINQIKFRLQCLGISLSLNLHNIAFIDEPKSESDK
jgi:hypothetical protein